MPVLKNQVTSFGRRTQRKANGLRKRSRFRVMTVFIARSSTLKDRADGPFRDINDDRSQSSHQGNQLGQGFAFCTSTLFG